MIADDSAELAVSTIERISRKWNPVIVQHLLDSGPSGFNEIQAQVEGISAKVLTDSLADLVEHELVERTVVSEAPLRVEYELTDHGRDLRSVIAVLAAWGERHLGGSPDPLVLVVDDDPRIAAMHAGWLADRFRVREAYSGEAAIRTVTNDVDAVLLDRHMPGVAGDEAARRIRALDLDVPIVLLTAVGPDLDVVDLPVEAYVEKPARRRPLVSVVEEVLSLGEEDRDVQELLALRAKRALLRGEKTREELADSAAYAGLEARIGRLETALDDATSIDARSVERVHPDGV